MIFSGGIEPDDAAGLDHLEPAADMHRRGGDDLAVLDHGELGGAAADVDVEDALALGARQRRGAGAVGGEHRLHVMAGGGADEVAALLGDDGGDRLRVLAPQRLAGEDHRAGVDRIRVDAGGSVGVVDDGAELGLVDVLLAAIRRERDAGLEQGFPRHHEIAAREVLAEAAQMDAREDDLGAGRADVDADAGQRHMVLDPDRIFLERAVVGEIVVVVRIAVMRMLEVDAVDVVAEGMALRARHRLAGGIAVSGCGNKGLPSMAYPLIHQVITALGRTENSMNRIPPRLAAAVITLATIAIPTVASAHPGHEGAGFVHGLLHPLGGLDHILAMVAVGLFAARLGGRALWLVPASFVTAMAARVSSA